MTNQKPKKMTLEERMAKCHFSLPVSKEEQEWMDMPSVGREFGSPEWCAAEAAGKLDEFLDGTWQPPD